MATEVKDVDRDPGADFLYKSFPKDFIWGASVAAGQVEGGWNEDGRSPSIWDVFAKSDASCLSGDLPEIACDSYHKWKEDVELIKELGLTHYRFSISWSRVLPDGTIDNINEKGIEYYDNLINALLDAGVQPMVTLFHNDLPQALEEKYGGFLSRDVISHFVDYAKLMFERFGDRVKYWVTFNEIHIWTTFAYAFGYHAPGIVDKPDINPYIATKNCLLAHALAYRSYDKDFREKQKGEVSITIDAEWKEPFNPENEDDVAAANREMQLSTGLVAHPIFSEKGDWPAEIKQLIAEKSKAQGHESSRLPDLNEEEIELLKGSADFFSVNVYSASIFRNNENDPQREPYFFTMDTNTKPVNMDPKWPKSGAFWLYGVPWAIRKSLNWIKKEYNNPRTIVAENGYPEINLAHTDDPERCAWIRNYINNVLKAIEIDGCNVFGYMVWSLLDNYEWSGGYGCRFGLVQVDFEDPERKRTPKKSYHWYKQLISDNGFEKGTKSAEDIIIPSEKEKEIHNPSVSSAGRSSLGSRDESLSTAQRKKGILKAAKEDASKLSKEKGPKQEDPKAAKEEALLEASGSLGYSKTPQVEVFKTTVGETTVTALKAERDKKDEKSKEQSSDKAAKNEPATEASKDESSPKSSESKGSEKASKDESSPKASEGESASKTSEDKSSQKASKKEECASKPCKSEEECAEKGFKEECASKPCKSEEECAEKGLKEKECASESREPKPETSRETSENKEGSSKASKMEDRSSESSDSKPGTSAEASRKAQSLEAEESRGSHELACASKPKEENASDSKPEASSEASKKEESAPKKEESVPKKEESAPKKEESVPKKEESAPKKEESAPKKEESAPKKEESASKLPYDLKEEKEEKSPKASDSEPATSPEKLKNKKSLLKAHREQISKPATKPVASNKDESSLKASAEEESGPQEDSSPKVDDVKRDDSETSEPDESSSKDSSEKPSKKETLTTKLKGLFTKGI